LEKCEDLPLENIKRYLDIISIERAKTFDSWLLVGMTLFNCNTESLLLWIKWSKSCTEYKNTSDGVYIQKWNEFTLYDNGISYLKYMAKFDNPELFSLIEYSVDKDNFEAIEFSKEYLLMDNDNKKDLLRVNVNKFITNETIKTLCIKNICLWFVYV